MAKKVLIVDKGMLSASMLAEILKKEGYEIVGKAKDGMEAVEENRNLKPDLIFMEIALPRLDGMEATRMIMEEDPSAVIVMCSEMSQGAMQQEAKQAGALGFVAKPFRSVEVLKAAEDALAEGAARPKEKQKLFGRTAEKVSVSEKMEQEKIREAEQGGGRKKYDCARMYWEGDIVPVDKTKALYWMEKAAGQGYARAQFECGQMYYNGEGTAQDLPRALYWMEKAAEQGDGTAQLNCSCMYYEGKGTAVDTGKGADWLGKACKCSNPEVAKRAKDYGYWLLNSN